MEIEKDMQEEILEKVGNTSFKENDKRLTLSDIETLSFIDNIPFGHSALLDPDHFNQKNIEDIGIIHHKIMKLKTPEEYNSLIKSEWHNVVRTLAFYSNFSSRELNDFRAYFNLYMYEYRMDKSNEDSERPIQVFNCFRHCIVSSHFKLPEDGTFRELIVTYGVTTVLQYTQSTETVFEQINREFPGINQKVLDNKIIIIKRLVNNSNYAWKGIFLVKKMLKNLNIREITILISSPELWLSKFTLRTNVPDLNTNDQKEYYYQHDDKIYYTSNGYKSKLQPPESYKLKKFGLFMLFE